MGLRKKTREMKIDERIVIPVPKSLIPKGRRAKTMWVKHTLMRFIYDTRNRIMNETGEDIFGVFAMTDCIEINFKGELETIPKQKQSIVR